MRFPISCPIVINERVRVATKMINKNYTPTFSIFSSQQSKSCGSNNMSLYDMSAVQMFIFVVLYEHPCRKDIQTASHVVGRIEEQHHVEYQ